MSSLSPSPVQPNFNFEKEPLVTNAFLFPFPPFLPKQDLCYAALSFANDTLKPGGHFVCKFYQGSEDKALEKMLKKLFTRVHRDKPDSSRSVSDPFWIGQDSSLVITAVWLTRLDAETGIEGGVLRCAEQEGGCCFGGYSSLIA